MKIISYNVNGIRAASRKGFIEWLKVSKPDIVCLQEIKCVVEQITELESQLRALGYHCYWFSALKLGYSGTAILSKIRPLEVIKGFGNESYDNEGRYIQANFKSFSIASLYFPSGSSGSPRQDFKMSFLSYLDTFFLKLKDKLKVPIILSGDFNICHQAIDIHNPEANKNTSGFLPQERQWFGNFLQSIGLIDAFRQQNPQPNHYSWWSYRANARKRNLGWRIDYHLIDKRLKKSIKNAILLPQAMHSDHCPVLLQLEI